MVKENISSRITEKDLEAMEANTIDLDSITYIKAPAQPSKMMSRG